jgi:hypothetical protein
MQYRSWLRHRATSRKIAGSIPDGVFQMFHLLNASRRTMTLRSTQCLIGTSTSDLLSRDKGSRLRELLILPHSCVECLKPLGISTSWSSRDLSRDIQGYLYLTVYITASQWHSGLVPAGTEWIWYVIVFDPRVAPL